jgi:hypothetical protein
MIGPLFSEMRNGSVFRLSTATVPARSWRYKKACPANLSWLMLSRPGGSEPGRLDMRVHRRLLLRG